MQRIHCFVTKRRFRRDNSPLSWKLLEQRISFLHSILSKGSIDSFKTGSVLLQLRSRSPLLSSFQAVCFGRQFLAFWSSMACFEFEIGLEEAENHFKTKLSRSFRPFSSYQFGHNSCLSFMRPRYHPSLDRTGVSFRLPASAGALYTRMKKNRHFFRVANFMSIDAPTTQYR